jgi:hypothetical protein
VDIQLRTVGPEFVEEQHCEPALLVVVRSERLAHGQGDVRRQAKGGVRGR